MSKALSLILVVGIIFGLVAGGVILQRRNTDKMVSDSIDEVQMDAAPMDQASPLATALPSPSPLPVVSAGSTDEELRKALGALESEMAATAPNSNDLGDIPYNQ